MKPRSCFWLLPLAIGWAGAAEPKPRPRLEPLAASEVQPEAAQPARVDENIRSFDDFLRAGALRAMGLEAYRVPRATGTKTEKAAKPHQAASFAETFTTSGDVLVLPKLEIAADRLSKLREKLAPLDENQSWETSSAEVWDKKTAVDKFLNPRWLRLGNYSSEASAAAARQRVEMLRIVRVLTLALWEAKTPEERARLQADIDELTGIMRFWQ